MDVSKTFEDFLKNLSVKNREKISRRYKKITRRLNDSYWSKDSETSNSLMVGSYGRYTAIDGISDLDMIFELPWSVRHKFNAYETNGQSALLQEVKGEIAKTFSRTKIRGDGQVIVVSFSNYVIEVLPSFKHSDGSYVYPDSSGEGEWRTTNPRPEIETLNQLNSISNGALKRLCRMVRSWKNRTGAPLGGMLVDTLCYNFMNANTQYHDRGFGQYDLMSKDFFLYLSNLDNDQEFWLAPGSHQRIYRKGKFVSKAKKALKRCLKAIEKNNQASANATWREVYGSLFPAHVSITKDATPRKYRNTEEFIEDKHNVDVRYNLTIDCKVTQDGFTTQLLRIMLARRFPLKFNKKLRFFVTSCNAPEPYTVMWKVRNIGNIAEMKDIIRGEIWPDGGNRARDERTSFSGSHFVECYVVKDGVCVARDRIDVPISG